jgi:hypothetical protein
VIGLNRKRGTLLEPRSRDVEQPDNFDDSGDKFIESGNYWLTNGPEGGGLCEAYLGGHVGIAWRRVENTSLAFGGRCREAGVRPSMGSVGDAYDNAMCESFFATLECELLGRRRFTSQAEARMAVFSYIEGWYNPARRHSGIGYLSPIAYETQMLNEPETT